MLKQSCFQPVLLGVPFEMSTGFLSNAEVEGFLAFARPEIRDIALELRNLVAAVCPSATEKILWGGLSYPIPQRAVLLKAQSARSSWRGTRFEFPSSTASASAIQIPG